MATILGVEDQNIELGPELVHWWFPSYEVWKWSVWWIVEACHEIVFIRKDRINGEGKLTYGTIRFRHEY